MRDNCTPYAAIMIALLVAAILIAVHEMRERKGRASANITYAVEITIEGAGTTTARVLANDPRVEVGLPGGDKVTLALVPVRDELAWLILATKIHHDGHIKEEWFTVVLRGESTTIFGITVRPLGAHEPNP